MLHRLRERFGGGHSSRSSLRTRLTRPFGRLYERAYEQLLRREIDQVPTHVAVIQDGNRRYAQQNGKDTPEGHRAGASTTEQVLEWCDELGIEELTLYAFSTENFARPDEELEPLFDLLAEKLREFADADRVHERSVRIHAIGDVQRLPPRVQQAVDYAEARTASYDQFRLNVALAYGGRNELTRAASELAAEVDDGKLSPDDVDVDEIDRRLYREPVREVDLIVRTGGDERTSNFLPWYANGNEAAVYFCTPYWPAFSKPDFLRGIRTYQARERSWRRNRVERAAALVTAVAASELAEARSLVGRLRTQLPRTEVREVEAALDEDVPDTDTAD